MFIKVDTQFNISKNVRNILNLKKKGEREKKLKFISYIQLAFESQNNTSSKISTCGMS